MKLKCSVAVLAFVLAAAPAFAAGVQQEPTPAGRIKTARKLYDKVAKYNDFIRYDHPL